MCQYMCFVSFAWTREKCLHEVLSPPPTKIRVHDYEAADERCKERTTKDCYTKNGDRHSSCPITEHVGKDSCNTLNLNISTHHPTRKRKSADTHSNWTSPKEPRKEPTDQDGLQILARRTSNFEDRETKRGYHERQPSSFQLRERRPEDRSRRKAQHVQRRAQRSDYRTHTKPLLYSSRRRTKNRASERSRHRRESL